MGRYDEYVSGKKTIELGGIKNELIADVKDYGDFVKLAVKMKENQDLGQIVDFATKVITKGTPKEELATVEQKEALERYLWENVRELTNALMIAFGLVTKKELADVEEEEKAKLQKKD